jgi:hypothetical protein
MAQSFMRTIGWTAVTSLAVSLTACGILPSEVCTMELRSEVTPSDTTVAVGASFTPRIALSSCGGKKRLLDTFTWSSADPAIVAIQPTTGRITALAAGETSVTVDGVRYGRDLGRVQVVVR